MKNSEDWIFQENLKRVMLSKHDSNDFYIEDGKYVFTEQYHIDRGYCCGNNCRHCAFEPKAQKGNTTIFINNG